MQRSASRPALLALLALLALVVGVGAGVAAAAEPPETVDVKLRKYGPPAGRSLQVGDTVAFEVDVAVVAAEGVTASGVRVIDQLPPNLRLVPGSLQWFGDRPTSIGHYAAEGAIKAAFEEGFEAWILRYSATVTAPGPATNTAVVLAGGQDPDMSNNVSTVALTVAYPHYDATVTKTASASEASVGDLVTYQVSWTNMGPGTAYDVRLRDDLPAGVQVVGSLPSSCTAASDGHALECRIGDTPPGTTRTFSYTIEVVSPSPDGLLRNLLWTRTAAGVSDPTDPVVSSVRVVPPQADLVVTKKASRTSAAVGDEVAFEITVGNRGPGTAFGVQLTDTLIPVEDPSRPAGVVGQLSVPPSACSLTEGADGADTASGFTCRLGDIPPGEARTIMCWVRLAATGQLANLARATTTSRDDDPSNDGAMPVITVEAKAADSATCQKCVLRNMRLCSPVCRANGQPRPGSKASCDECHESVRERRCAAQCSGGS
jgi:uncharacterized repeat protein (TIGR01451 family)